MGVPTEKQRLYLINRIQYTDKEVDKLTFEEAWDLISKHMHGEEVKPPHIIRAEKKALREEEAKKVKVSLTDKRYNAGVITIRFNKLPETCPDCPLYQMNEFYDEYAGFGDGISHSCPFGASLWGCAIKRPKDCPIKKVEVTK